MRFSAIFFGDESGIISHFVVADSLAELIVHTSNCRKGQSCIVTTPEEVMALDRKNLREVPDLKIAYALVEAKRGKPSESNRVVVIDDKTGEIETVALADPHLDAIAGKTLYQHDEAAPGWALDATGEFAKPAEEAEPAKTAAEITREAIAASKIDWTRNNGSETLTGADGGNDGTFDISTGEPSKDAG